MALSNNAQNLYAFEINRIEPLNVPLLSRLTGPFRYEFVVGALCGHTFMLNPAYELSPSSSVPNVISFSPRFENCKKNKIWERKICLRNQSLPDGIGRDVSGVYLLYIPWT
jgi:hypothetical protein